MAYRTYSTANGWIVDKNGKGDFTSIGAAITAFNAAVTAGSLTNIDVFLHVNTYTENFTIPSGMNIVGFRGDGLIPNVTIIGKVTMSTAGTASASNVRLQTNSDFAVVVSGSVASILNLNNCFLNCSTTTGISYTSSSASSQLNLTGCSGDIGNASAAIFASSSAGALFFSTCDFANSIGSTTANTVSAGNLGLRRTAFQNPTTTSGTSALSTIYFQVSTTATSTKALTCGGSGIHGILYSDFQTGTATSISVNNTTGFSNCSISTSNVTAAIDGSGTISYSEIAFSNTGNNITTSNVTPRNVSIGGLSFDGGVNTMSNYAVSTWTPTLTGTGGATTYTAQTGYYIRVGNMVQVQGFIQGTAATGTGNAVIGGLPFTIKSQTNGNVIGSIVHVNAAGWTWPASTTSIAFLGLNGTKTGNIYATGSGSANGAVQMANAAFLWEFTVTYEI